MSQAHANATVERLQVRSRFANMEVDPRDVVTFPDGLPGYESCRQYQIRNANRSAADTPHGMAAIVERLRRRR